MTSITGSLDWNRLRSSLCMPFLIMRIRTKLLALLVLTMTAIATSAATEPAPKNPSGFAIHRGINLSHWLSQDFNWAPREEWITENDIRYIASLGFDHVRLPVDEIELWHEDNSPNEDAFALLNVALEWCKRSKLRVIIDLHSVRAHHFNASNEGGQNTLWNNPEARKHFLDLWRQLSDRLHEYPNDFLAYEIMNEPTAPTADDWNKILGQSIELIRAREPARVIIVGANEWQIPNRVPELEIPEGDPNLILSFHTYSPLMLTHHTADWVPAPIKDFPGPVTYPGPVIDPDTFAQFMKQFPADDYDYLMETTDDWGPERFLELLEPAIDSARESGLQLYCGEFGCLPSVPREARLAYYRDIVGVFEANGIAWANWEYKGDFGIAEWHGLDSLDGAPDVQMIDALMQR